MLCEKRRPDSSENSILPLINVVFLLLIFFMIAGSLAVTEPFEVVAPESLSEGLHEAQTLRILLGENGQMALQGKIMPEAELLEAVKQHIETEPGTRIQLKADAALAGNRVVLFMEKLRESGVDKLLLMTLQKSQ